MEKHEKRDIRAEILEKARLMFGEEGYNTVSLRNIADALGISVGNLTYHYKKKEDLIEAVFMEHHAHYQRFQTPGTLAELHEMFLKDIRLQKENAYYFRHYTQLAQCSPRLYEIQLQAKRDKNNAYLGAFQQFERGGYFKPEGITDQYQSLAYALTMMNIYWLPEEENQVPAIRCMWNLVYPNLTQKGVMFFKDAIDPELQKIN